MARSIFFYTDSRLLGGAERAMMTLVESLDRSAWQPTVLLEDADSADIDAITDWAGEAGAAVIRVPPMPLGLGGAKEIPALARQLRRARPDVFHAHLSWPLADKWGMAAAVAARAPAVIATVHLIPEFELETASKLQLRLLSRGVDRYIAVSSAIAEELVDRFGWPARKVLVVPNGIDVERFGVEPGPLGKELDRGRQLVLTCARLDQQKGHPTLIEAAAEVPDADFLLAGEGPERRRLEELSSRLGVADRIRFLGDRSDVPALLAAADVFALPSFYEGTSLAVLEAMAASRAVVSSEIGGTRELIEDGRTGLLVPPGDPAALAAGLRRVLGDRRLREELGSEARRVVEAKFSRERAVARVAEIYEEAIVDAG